MGDVEDVQRASEDNLEKNFKNFLEHVLDKKSPKNDKRKS